MVWACAARGRRWLGGEICGVWGGGSRPTGRGEDMEGGCAKDCQARGLSEEDAVDRGGWKRLMEIG